MINVGRLHAWNRWNRVVDIVNHTRVGTAVISW